MMTATTPLHRTLVVFTDIDGTLIDHNTYDAGLAKEAVHRLANHNVPLIFCSSKTFSEQRFVQNQLGLVQPFIFENGSAIAVPSGYFPKAVWDRYGLMSIVNGFEIIRFAHADALAVKSLLMDFPDIKGFKDVPDDELGSLTGLSGNALQRARERWFTETLVTPLNMEQANKLAGKLEASGFALSRGGRFYTIQSAQVDKGKALRLLAGIFREIRTLPPVFAAIGDSPNDIPMFASVDHAYLVQQYDGTWMDMVLAGVNAIEGIGPVGFSIAVNLLLSANSK